MQNVEFFSFANMPKAVMEEWTIAIKEVLQQGRYIGGEVVETFEKSWSSYLGVNHTVGVGNGYDAMYIALKALKINSGDFVAVPNHTFIATWLSVNATGASPIGIDCDTNGLLDLDKLEESTIKFSAVIPVHMHGQMVDMDRLTRWATAKKIHVIEDCAQAHGAIQKNKKAGTWGDIGAFSFYPTKNLGAAGDAGAIVTDNESLAMSIKSIANYGSAIGNKYRYENIGINSRLDPIQAGVLSVNLKYLDKWNQLRIEIANEYNFFFRDNDITVINDTHGSVYHHYAIRSKNRDQTRKLLTDNGIGTEIHYPEPASKTFEKLTKMNVTENQEVSLRLANETLSIPLSPWMTKEETNYVKTIFQKPEILETIY